MALTTGMGRPPQACRRPDQQARPSRFWGERAAKPLGGSRGAVDRQRDPSAYRPPGACFIPGPDAGPGGRESGYARGWSSPRRRTAGGSDTFLRRRSSRLLAAPCEMPNRAAIDACGSSRRMASSRPTSSSVSCASKASLLRRVAAGVTARPGFLRRAVNPGIVPWPRLPSRRRSREPSPIPVNPIGPVSSTHKSVVEKLAIQEGAQA